MDARRDRHGSTGASPRGRAPRRDWHPLVKVAAGIVVSFTLLLALECIARITKTIRDDTRPQSEEWFVYSPTHGWRPRPGWSGSAYGSDAFREFDSRGFPVIDTAQIRNKSRPRLIGIGDSNMVGFGSPPEDSFLERLDATFPDLDCINLGVTGYSTYQSLVRLESDALALEPDVIVVCGNFNDRRYVLSKAEQDGPSAFRRKSRAMLLKQLTRNIYLLRAARIFNPPVLPASTQYDLRELPPRVPPEAYRANLASIASLAKDHGILPVFLLLEDNPMQAGPVREGIARLEQGDLETAIQLLRPTAQDPQNPFAMLAALHLGRALESAAQELEASLYLHPEDPWWHFQVGHPILPVDPYLQAMRDVAAAEGVLLVDGAAALAARPEVYLDGCHFNAEGHELIAGELAAGLVTAHAPGTMLETAQ